MAQGGRSVFAQFHWTRERRLLAAVLTAGAIVLYALGAMHLGGAWPSSYVWSELLISYQGGFVRRGLLGEVAYLLYPLVSAQLWLPVLFFALYLLVAVRVIVLVVGNLTFPSLLFALSPVALSFPVNDLEAFGRKDVVLITAFILSLAIIRRVPRASLALAAILVIYAAVTLIHETALLYLPLAVAFLLHTRGAAESRAWTIAALVAAGAVAIAMVGATLLFKGDAALESAMIAAWQERVPRAYSPPLAAAYLSEGVATMLAGIAGQVGSVVTILGFLLCAFLGGAPVVAHALARPPRLSADPLHRTMLKVAAGAMLVAFAVGADWGRFIHLFWMHAFIFIASLGTTAAQPEPLFPEHARRGLAILLPIALLVVYAVAWRMGHSALRDNPFWPGHIFDLQPIYRFGYGTMVTPGK